MFAKKSRLKTRAKVYFVKNRCCQIFRTKDILHVKQILGHKQLKNTEIYMHLINFESDDWYVAFAKTLQEETKLVEAGFEYVRYSEKDEVAIYRKRI